MQDVEQKLREAMSVAAEHLDMSAFELSYPKEDVPRPRRPHGSGQPLSSSILSTH